MAVDLIRYSIAATTIDGPALEPGAAFEVRLVGFVQKPEPVGGRGVGPHRRVPVDGGRAWAPEGYAGWVFPLRVTDWSGPMPGRAQDAGSFREMVDRLEASLESLRAVKALRLAVEALEEIVNAPAADFDRGHRSVVAQRAGEALVAMAAALDGPVAIAEAPNGEA